MSLFISDAMAEGAAAGPGEGMSLLFLVGMFVIMYLFIIRPQVKRQKEHKKLVEGISKGDEVQTMGGLMGKVTEVGETFVKLEVADNIIVTVRRVSIEAVMPKGSLKEM